MSVSAFDLYLLSVLGDLSNALSVTAIFVGASTAVISLFYFFDIWEDMGLPERSVTYLRHLALSFVVLGMLAVLTPSKKELIAIFAIPHVINNEKVQQLPDVFLDYVIREFSVEEKKE